LGEDVLLDGGEDVMADDVANCWVTVCKGTVRGMGAEPIRDLCEGDPISCGLISLNPVVVPVIVVVVITEDIAVDEQFW
jgi:hypothetical protein